MEERSMEERSARGLYFERALAQIEFKRQWGEDDVLEGHAVIQSLDGGQTWEFEGTFGMPVEDLTPHTTRLIRQHGFGRERARCIPYSKLDAYGLDIGER